MLGWKVGGLSWPDRCLLYRRTVHITGPPSASTAVPSACLRAGAIIPSTQSTVLNFDWVPGCPVHPAVSCPEPCHVFRLTAGAIKFSPSDPSCCLLKLTAFGTSFGKSWLSDCVPLEQLCREGCLLWLTERSTFIQQSVLGESGTPLSQLRRLEALMLEQISWQEKRERAERKCMDHAALVQWQGLTGPHLPILLKPIV